MTHELPTRGQLVEEAKQLLRARKWLMEMDRHHYCENALCSECDTKGRQVDARTRTALLGLFG